MTALTEAEAKEKLCCGPLAGMSVSQGQCAGSKCMAWRLAPQEYDEFYTLNGVRTVPGGSYNFEELGAMRRQEVPLPRKGFCGLAGQP